MGRILQDLAEALRMADELHFFSALPIYGIGYALFAWIVANALKAWRDVFN